MIEEEEEWDLDPPPLVPQESEEDDFSLGVLSDIFDTPKKPTQKRKISFENGPKQRPIWPSPNREIECRKRKSEKQDFLDQCEEIGLDAKELEEIVEDLFHACKRAKRKSEKKKMSRTVFKTLRQLTEDLHREITEEKVKNEMSPDQRSVTNGLRKLDPIPELLRQNAVDIVSPVKDPPMTFGKKAKRKYAFGPKNREPIKLRLSPKTKISLKSSPNILALKKRIDLSPKTLAKEEENKQTLKELAKTFYGEETPEKKKKSTGEGEELPSTPPISQD